MTEPFRMPVKLPLRLFRAEQKFTRWFEAIPSGISLEQVMSPDYWQHVRNNISLYDVFEVVSDDGTYEAEFRVIAINKLTGNIKFRLIREWHATGADVVKPMAKVEAPRFAAKWNVGKRSWCVQELSTAGWVAEGLDRDSAEAEAARLNDERRAA